jgi:peptidoglycan/xylan/chitin deacetylase (PgdA/CDA1 family)
VDEHVTPTPVRTRRASTPASTPASVRTPVLMYHSVAASASPSFRTFVTDPADFREHMAAVVDAGYEATTVSDHVSGSRSRTEPGDRGVVLTFDDAFQDFHTTVLPVLVDLGLRATLYVPTSYVGGTSRWLQPDGEADRPMMSWSALAEAAASGVEIGSHSRTHPQLDRLPRELVRAEVRDSRSLLEDRLQQEVRSFAYPFGYHDGSVKRAVAEAGYLSACAVRDLPSTTADPFAISRLTVTQDTDAAALLELMDRRSGLVDEVRSAARARLSRALRRVGAKRRHDASSWDED